MNFSTGQVVRQVLLNQENPLIILPPAIGDWSCFVSSMPEDSDNCVAIYGTSGTIDGRIMRDGETVAHPGNKWIVRAVDEPTGEDFIANLLVRLDAIRQAAVVMEDGTTYLLQGVHRTGNPMFFGEEPERRRMLWVFNTIMTVSLVS